MAWRAAPSDALGRMRGPSGHARVSGGARFGRRHLRNGRQVQLWDACPIVWLPIETRTEALGQTKEIGAMRNVGVLSVLSMIVLAATGCNTPQERAVSGGAIGAAGGAVVGQAIGRNTGSTLAGAAIGGVAGAMIGAGTAPGECRFQSVDSRGRPVFDRHGQPVTYLAPCRR